MENYEFIYLTSGAINAILQIIVVIACGLLLWKNRAIATVLMFSGSLLSIIFLGLSFVITALAANNSPESVVKTNAILSIVGHLPSLIFALGLLLFVIKQVKNQS